jgi:hypothetical protein
MPLRTSTAAPSPRPCSAADISMLMPCECSARVLYRVRCRYMGATDVKLDSDSKDATAAPTTSAAAAGAAAESGAARKPIAIAADDTAPPSAAEKAEASKPVAGDPLSLPRGLRWRKKCPLSHDKLQRTGEVDVDHCAVCNKSVYLVRTIEELRAKAAERKCVSFSRTLVDARIKDEMSMQMLGDIEPEG